MNNNYEINEIENYLNVSGNNTKNTDLKAISNTNNVENYTVSIDKKIYLTIKETSLLFNIGKQDKKSYSRERLPLCAI